MAGKIGQVVCRRQKGKLTIIGMGSTPRGQRYIADVIPLAAKSTTSPEFKSELAAAVNKMLPPQE